MPGHRKSADRHGHGHDTTLPSPKVPQILGCSWTGDAWHRVAALGLILVSSRFSRATLSPHDSSTAVGSSGRCWFLALSFTANGMLRVGLILPYSARISVGAGCFVAMVVFVRVSYWPLGGCCTLVALRIGSPGDALDSHWHLEQSLGAAPRLLCAHPALHIGGRRCPHSPPISGEEWACTSSSTLRVGSLQPPRASHTPRDVWLFTLLTVLLPYSAFRR